MPHNLTVTSLFDKPALCVQAAAICQRAVSRVIAINRCPHPAPVPITAACGGGRSGWKSLEIFNASLDPPGSMWALLTEDYTPQGGGPMRPSRGPGGEGSAVALAPYSLTVVTLM